jgi:Insertion element 4 transposase N-terminal
MSQPIAEARDLADLSSDYSLSPFSERLSPLIKETLRLQQKGRDRHGTKLVSTFVVWLVLGLTLRRDKNCIAVLDWLISGWRWLACSLPKQLVAEGAISHARVRVGVTVFEVLFNRLVSTFAPLPADFHQWVSVAFDGSTGSMPDSHANRAHFGKPKSRRQGEASAYPQLRWMSLLAIGPRLLLDVAYGPYAGKGTGERTLMMTILKRLQSNNFLYMVDAGLYSFAMMWQIQQQDNVFLLKVSCHPTLRVLKRLPDGSYLSEMKGKLLDPNRTTETRNAWNAKTLTVRVIAYQIPGFRATRLVTNILEPSISAKALVFQYHKRWDIELCFDEIKTHQCATLRGQMPTLFRSKRPDLVEQELYAMMLLYNLIRETLLQAAAQANKNPLALSFLNALHIILDAIPQMSRPMAPEIALQQRQYLLSLLADAEIDRPRRPRVNDRVIKVKMSKFKRKTSQHRTRTRDVEKSLEILISEAA